ncbi:hypothetical protein D5086_002746 [Populus alba]|uniref:Uncharacterized protein n=1 Tax=Populus alba TaxID=43335 RepID=A0ACC4D2H2_POPAL
MASETSGPQIVKSSSSRWWTEAKELRSGARLPELAPTAKARKQERWGSVLGGGWFVAWKQEEAKVVAVPIGFLNFSKYSPFAFWANAILHCPFARACPAQMGPVPTLCAATLDFYFT